MCLVCFPQAPGIIPKGSVSTITNSDFQQVIVNNQQYDIITGLAQKVQFILCSDVETLAWATAQIHCQCTLSISNVPTAVAQLEGGAEPSPAVELSPSQTYFHPTKGERHPTSCSLLTMHHNIISKDNG